MQEPGPIFAALADETRRQIVLRLADGADASATEIAAGLPITRQAVAKHLAILADAGLVAGARAGRETRYALTPAPLDDAATWVAQVGRRWDRRLGALAERARRPG